MHVSINFCDSRSQVSRKRKRTIISYWKLQLYTIPPLHVRFTSKQFIIFIVEALPASAFESYVLEATSSIETLPDSTWSLARTWRCSCRIIVHRILRILTRFAELKLWLSFEWSQHNHKEASHTKQCKKVYLRHSNSVVWSIFLNFLLSSL